MTHLRLVPPIDEDLAGPFGRCDTCGAPCDGAGCPLDRSHAAALDAGFVGPTLDEIPAGTIAARDVGCTCGFEDVGTGETGPWVVAVIDEACPLHGGPIEILGFDE